MKEDFLEKYQILRCYLDDFWQDSDEKVNGFSRIISYLKLLNSEEISILESKFYYLIYNKYVRELIGYKIDYNDFFIKELAVEFGLAEVTLYKFIRGELRLSINTLDKIVKILAPF